MASNNNNNNKKVEADLKGGKINFDYLKKNNMDIADLIKMSRQNKQSSNLPSAGNNKGNNNDDDSDGSYYEEIIEEEEIVEDDLSLLVKKKPSYHIPHFHRPTLPANPSATLLTGSSSSKPPVVSRISAPVPAARKPIPPPPPPAAATKPKKAKKKKEIDGSKVLLVQSAEQRLTSATKDFQQAIQEAAAIVSLLEFMLNNTEDWDEDDLEEVDGTIWETRSTFVEAMEEAKSIVDRLESAKHEVMGTRSKGSMPKKKEHSSMESSDSLPEENPKLGSVHRASSFKIPDLATLQEEDTERDWTDHHSSTSSGADSVEGTTTTTTPLFPAATKKKAQSPPRPSASLLAQPAPSDELAKAKSDFLKFAQEGKKLANKLTSPVRTSTSASEDMIKAKQSMMQFAKEGAALAIKLESRSDPPNKLEEGQTQASISSSSSTNTNITKDGKGAAKQEVTESVVTTSAVKNDELAKAKQSMLQYATEGAALAEKLEKTKDKVKQQSETLMAPTTSATAVAPMTKQEIKKKELEDAKRLFLDAARQGAALVAALEAKLTRCEAIETKTAYNSGTAEPSSSVDKNDVDIARGSFMKLAQQGADLVNRLEHKINTPRNAATEEEQLEIDASERNSATNKELTKAGDDFLETARESANMLVQLNSKLDETDIHSSSANDNTTQRNAFLATAQEGAEMVARFESKVASIEDVKTTKVEEPTSSRIDEVKEEAMCKDKEEGKQAQLDTPVVEETMKLPETEASKEKDASKLVTAEETLEVKESKNELVMAEANAMQKDTPGAEEPVPLPETEASKEEDALKLVAAKEPLEGKESNDELVMAEANALQKDTPGAEEPAQLSETEVSKAPVAEEPAPVPETKASKEEDASKPMTEEPLEVKESNNELVMGEAHATQKDTPGAEERAPLPETEASEEEGASKPMAEDEPLEVTESKLSEGDRPMESGATSEASLPESVADTVDKTSEKTRADCTSGHSEAAMGDGVTSEAAGAAPINAEAVSEAPVEWEVEHKENAVVTSDDKAAANELESQVQINDQDSESAKRDSDSAGEANRQQSSHEQPLTKEANEESLTMASEEPLADFDTTLVSHAPATTNERADAQPVPVSLDPEKKVLYSDIRELYEAGTQVPMLSQLYDPLDVAAVVAIVKADKEKSAATKNSDTFALTPPGEIAQDGTSTTSFLSKEAEVARQEIATPLETTAEEIVREAGSEPSQSGEAEPDEGIPSSGEQPAKPLLMPATATTETVSTDEKAEEKKSEEPAEPVADSSGALGAVGDQQQEGAAGYAQTDAEAGDEGAPKVETGTESAAAGLAKLDENVADQIVNDEKRPSVLVRSADILALRASTTASFDSDHEDVEDGKDVPAEEQKDENKNKSSISDAATKRENQLEMQHVNGATDDLESAQQSFLAAAMEGAAMISQLEKKLGHDDSNSTDQRGETNETDDSEADSKEDLMAKARKSFLAAAQEGAALVALMGGQNEKVAPTMDETDVLHTSNSFKDAALLVDKLDKSVATKEVAKGTPAVSIEEETTEEEVEVEDEVEAAKKAFLQFAKEGASLVSKLESKFAGQKKVEDDDDDEIIEEVIESDEEGERAVFLEAAKADFLSFSKGLDKKLGR